MDYRGWRKRGVNIQCRVNFSPVFRREDSIKDSSIGQLCQGICLARVAKVWRSCCLALGGDASSNRDWVLVKDFVEQ